MNNVVNIVCASARKLKMRKKKCYIVDVELVVGKKTYKLTTKYEELS